MSTTQHIEAWKGVTLKFRLFRTGGEVTCSTTKTEEEEEEEEEEVEFTPDRAHSTKVPSAAEHRVWCVLLCFIGSRA